MTALNQALKHGGPAFPVLHSIDGNWVKEPREDMLGMTLRDYFAGQALQGMCATDRHMWDHPDIGNRAYRAADMMLVARAKASIP